MGLFEELERRELVHQITQGEPPLPELLATPGQTVYAGFDPTAPSLHVGNLVPLLGLRRFQLAGHKVIALAGGATGLVGDPSGKSEERNLQTAELIRANLDGQKAQLRRLLDFDGPNPATLVDNLDWTQDVTFLEFLRDVGKHFTINNMLRKDSVKNRIDREGAGISFTEFSYMLLQASDFLHLLRSHDCTIQVGGSDQWGNMTAGTELIRRVTSRQAHCLTFPLLTNADGSKFGKSVAGAIWLDPERTSPFAFRQFWFNTTDADVRTRLLTFTFRDVEEIEALCASEEPRAAQRILARDMTTLIHGETEADKVEAAAKVLFDPKGDLRQVPLEYMKDAFDGAPVTEVPRARFDGDGASLLDLVVDTVYAGAQKRGAARRDLTQNAIAVNGVKISDPDHTLTAADLLHERYLIIRKGKKQQFLVDAQ